MKSIAGLIAAASLAASPAHAADKPTVVLVHGAFETSGVWQGVEAKLEADGFTVVAPELPGRTGNPAAPDKVSLDGYRDTVSGVVAKAKGPVVLVGHSFGGIVISAVAEANAPRIKQLVYVAAYLPRNGESLLSLATSDADAKIGPALTIDKAHGIASIAPAARGELFANGAPKALQDAVSAAVIDEPLAPLATPVKLGAAFAKVPKSYVHTAFDQVVSPALQVRMVAATPAQTETTLQTGHTPFLTDVAGLVTAIEKAAQ